MTIRRLIGAGLAAVAAVALCAPLALTAGAGPDAEQLRLAAEARWRGRPFDGYRIISRAGDCEQRGQFRAGKIVSLHRQNCFDTVRTVERLFAMVERSADWGLASPRCAPSGCACKETRLIYAVYDARLGYPHAIRLRRYRGVDWAYLLARPESYPATLDCLSPPEIDLVTVLSLEPAP